MLSIEVRPGSHDGGFTKEGKDRTAQKSRYPEEREGRVQFFNYYRYKNMKIN